MGPAILTYLQSDAALVGLLPGGIYDATAVGVISRQSTPAAFDSDQEILPCALVAFTGDVPRNRVANRLDIAIYLYQRSGEVTIDSARLRIHALLYHTHIPDVAWLLMDAGSVLHAEDTTLKAALQISRWSGLRRI
jgi:hypothetical protein